MKELRLGRGIYKLQGAGLFIKSPVELTFQEDREDFISFDKGTLIRKNFDTLNFNSNNNHIILLNNEEDIQKVMDVSFTSDVFQGLEDYRAYHEINTIKGHIQTMSSGQQIFVNCGYVEVAYFRVLSGAFIIGTTAGEGIYLDDSMRAVEIKNMRFAVYIKCVAAGEINIACAKHV